jgi:acetolactate synthase-1/2/3 large subunit
MRIADYIIKYLADIGVKHIFAVVGGGAMYLNDALKKEKRITPIFCHHEQACAFAAEGYARVNNQLAVVLVTSGPGVTNCLTGVAGQWTDSVPVLYISGQVKYKTTLHAQDNNNLRQVGDQEVNIIDMVTPITKHAKMILPEDSIKYELKLAIHYATSGRKGPVWLDIPVDVQNKSIEDNDCGIFNIYNSELTEENIKDISYIAFMILTSKRPLVVAGHGIRLGNAMPKFNELINNVEIPVVTTFNGFDLVDSNHHNYVGRIGSIGTRAGNFALQNADLILFLGTRNNIRQISYNWENFAPNARKIIVDIDQAELSKNTIQGDVKICCDVKNFLTELNYQMVDYPVNDEDIKWLSWCKERKEKYPVILDEYRNSENINPYYFMEVLTRELSSNPDAIVVSANGTACVTLFQAGIIRKGQRMFWNSGIASMGYALPAAIGACLASGKEVICIEGDGSLQMNIQELATIKHYNLPIRIFVLCNGGYKSLQITQENHFNADYTGCTHDDLTFPDLESICNAYGLGYDYMDRTEHLKSMFYYNTPIITEVVLGNYEFAPKLAALKMDDGSIQSPSLENMSPFLSKEEMEGNKYE